MVIDESIAPVPGPRQAPPPPSSTQAHGSVLHETVNAREARTDWSKDEIREVFHTPLMELAFNAVCHKHPA